MTTVIGHAYGPNFITLTTANRTYNVDSGHAKWAEIVAAVKAKDFDLALQLVATKPSFATGSRRVRVEHGMVTLDGTPVHSALAQHIVRLVNEGFDAAPFILFMEKLEANPSSNSREQIFRFVEANKLTINTDGNLLLYKNVGHDYWDIHTGHTYQYRVGDTVTMERRNVDDNPNRTCSAGIHVCSLGYLASFPGQHTVI